MRIRSGANALAFLAVALSGTVALAQFRIHGAGHVDAASFTGDGSGLSNLAAESIVGGPLQVQVFGPSDLRGVVAPSDYRAQTILESWSLGGGEEVVALPELDGAALRQLVLGPVAGANGGTCVVEVEALSDPQDPLTAFGVGLYSPRIATAAAAPRPPRARCVPSPPSRRSRGDGHPMTSA